MTTQLSEQDLRNQAAWMTTAARKELDDNDLYTDLGEEHAIDGLRERVRGQPILDLGVGLGRTIPILAPLTDDYRAIDYMPRMVETCHERHPRARVELGDARDLTGVPSEHFGLVQFSYNGIDAIAASDRKKVFASVRRVLRPGGTFLFSALNLDGPGFRARPWHVQPPENIVALARAARWMPRHTLNWLRTKKLDERGDGYAVAALSAHHWTIVAHYTTLARQLDELAREGFQPEVAVYDNKAGALVKLGDDTSLFDWFHFVARS